MTTGEAPGTTTTTEPVREGTGTIPDLFLAAESPKNSKLEAFGLENQPTNEGAGDAAAVRGVFGSKYKGCGGQALVLTLCMMLILTMCSRSAASPRLYSA